MICTEMSAVLQLISVDCSHILCVREIGSIKVVLEDVKEMSIRSLRSSLCNIVAFISFKLRVASVNVSRTISH